MIKKVAKTVAVAVLASSLAACGGGASSGADGAVPVGHGVREAPDLVDIPGVGLVPAQEALTYLGGMGGAETERRGGHDLVDIPGVGLVPWNEALTYLGGMGGAEAEQR